MVVSAESPNSGSGTPWTPGISARQLGRWLGVVYVVGAITAWAWILVPHPRNGGDDVVVTMAAIAFVGGLALVVGLADRLPPWAFHLIIIGVQVVITVGYASVGRPGNDARLFFIWATPIAALFFRPLVAAAHAGIAGLALAIGLATYQPVPSTGVRIWLMTMASLFTVEAVVSWAAVVARRSSAEMRHTLSHDPLTDLANRTLCTEHLEAALVRRREDGGQVVLLLLDLDAFKAVNDTYGHQAGDELLIALAGRLSARLADSAMIARLGGDEFAIVVDDPVGEVDVDALSSLVVEAWSEPFGLTTCTLMIAGSVGVAVANGDDQASSLMRNADAAMYHAKRDVDSNVSTFDGAQQFTASRRRTIEQTLAAAMEHGQLRLAYQPIVDVATGFTHSVEALLRWDHPLLGEIPPVELIDVAERSGAIHRLGLWTIDNAVRQLSQWRSDGVVADDFGVSVNVSGVQLHGTFAASVQTLLEHHRFSAGLLRLEVHEAVVLEARPEIDRVLRELGDVGVGLILDDFGSGVASLGHLERTNFHTIKIDRTFIAGLEVERTRQAVVTALVALADWLDVHVIAEGVETSTQLDVVEQLGCRNVQGYVYAAPMLAVAASAYLAIDRERLATLN